MLRKTFFIFLCCVTSFLIFNTPVFAATQTPDQMLNELISYFEFFVNDPNIDQVFNRQLLDELNIYRDYVTPGIRNVDLLSKFMKDPIIQRLFPSLIETIQSIEDLDIQMTGLGDVVRRRELQISKLNTPSISGVGPLVNNNPLISIYLEEKKKLNKQIKEIRKKQELLIESVRSSMNKFIDTVPEEDFQNLFEKQYWNCSSKSYIEAQAKRLRDSFILAKEAQEKNLKKLLTMRDVLQKKINVIDGRIRTTNILNSQYRNLINISETLRVLSSNLHDMEEDLKLSVAMLNASQTFSSRLSKRIHDSLPVDIMSCRLTPCIPQSVGAAVKKDYPMGDIDPRALNPTQIEEMTNGIRLVARTARAQAGKLISATIQVGGKAMTVLALYNAGSNAFFLYSNQGDTVEQLNGVAKLINDIPTTIVGAGQLRSLVQKIAPSAAPGVVKGLVAEFALKYAFARTAQTVGAQIVKGLVSVPVILVSAGIDLVHQCIDYQKQALGMSDDTDRLKKWHNRNCSSLKDQEDGLYALYGTLRYRKSDNALGRELVDEDKESAGILSAAFISLNATRKECEKAFDQIEDLKASFAWVDDGLNKYCSKVLGTEKDKSVYELPEAGYLFGF